MEIPNRGPQLLAVDIALVAIAVLANGLRCIVRIKMVKAFGLDDWLMAIATLFFILYTASSILGVTFGTGRHHRDLSTENVQIAKHCWWYCYLSYCVSTILTKISIGYFLLRIPTKRVHILTIYAAMGTSVVAGLTFFFVTIFQCHPVSYFWDKYQDGTCVNMNIVIALGFLYSACSIVTDFTFAILPAFIVWNLQLKRRTKIALIPLLTMGVVASAAVIARLPYVVHIGSPDFLWATLDIAIWSTVEQGLGITAGSLAALRPLFQILIHRFGISTHPIEQRPSNYDKATPAASYALGSRRKPSQNDLAMYKISAVAETRHSDEESLRKNIDPHASPFPPTHDDDQVFQRSIELSRSPDHVYSNDARHVAKDDRKRGQGDEREVQWKSSRGSSEEGMQIMVERSFYIIEEERTSIVLRGYKYS